MIYSNVDLVVLKPTDYKHSKLILLNPKPIHFAAFFGAEKYYD